jgi:hypothetical protein
LAESESRRRHFLRSRIQSRTQIADRRTRGKNTGYAEVGLLGPPLYSAGTKSVLGRSETMTSWLPCCGSDQFRWASDTPQSKNERHSYRASHRRSLPEHWYFYPRDTGGLIATTRGCRRNRFDGSHAALGGERFSRQSGLQCEVAGSATIRAHSTNDNCRRENRWARHARLSRRRLRIYGGEQRSRFSKAHTPLW